MPKIILETIVGSTLHGTSVEDGLEDLDIMAIMLEDAKDFVGFTKEDVVVERTKPEGVRSEAGDVDFVSYGLKKYLHLALKGNPTILLALFSTGKNIRKLSPEGATLQSLFPKIVSKQVYAPYKGYMHQQHQRLLGSIGQKRCTRPELVEAYGFDTKYAGHIVRLGLQGKELLSTGKLTLPIEDKYRSLVVDVRTGKYTLPQVSELINQLEHDLDEAGLKCSLPNSPDYEFIENWMIECYLNYWLQK